jgi:hypothetical protein
MGLCDVPVYNVHEVCDSRKSVSSRIIVNHLDRLFGWSCIVQLFNTSCDGCSGTTNGVHPGSESGGNVTLRRSFSIYGIIRTIYLCVRCWTLR